MTSQYLRCSSCRGIGCDQCGGLGSVPPPETLTAGTMQRCYDCKAFTTAWVLEYRITGGDPWGTTGSQVVVHESRRACQIQKEREAHVQLEMQRVQRIKILENSITSMKRELAELQAYKTQNNSND